ncbi:molybdenum cofactor biosynthesis protein B [Wenzhouxiangella sp. AB-CW3]|uniref:molybdenum cofactor biosynthesis protein B n=1 Tax=Wenzhouxiangella sp. AB-CW3 TaxID=2771012 RepID=UPI00168B7EC8|nr:molybdenum cofactor biosynthesis protein B [Wenzhouxiangella sp. AB-CW3]QOC22447.1 molybdenum cofactor biosynthesis protein B [Wenzhouxiangella sp. AB-CW3]
MSKTRCQSHTPLKPLSIAVLTVSDSRTRDNDTSGDTLSERIVSAGHVLADRKLLPDDIFQLRAAVSAWIAADDVDCVLITGGTGITGRDSTPEAIGPLLVREIPGFGELFRYYSLEEIGTSTIQSRAFAGTANATLIFGLPGSTGACRTAWDRILEAQLDSRTGPCNFVSLIPRLNE